MTGGRDDWARYWREVATASGATLADLPAAVQQRLDAPWAKLAASLPPKAKLLDLATGGGIVLAMLRHRRRDLRLIGVDAAPTLPARTGMTLRANVDLAALPLADASFAAITSRFGIEYADLEAAAAEAARVARSGAQLCLVVHHADSPVLRHNRARYEALRWAARESGHMQTAANLVQARATIALPTPPSFRAAVTEAGRRFPQQSAAAEFLTGLVQLLDAGLGRPGAAAPGLDVLMGRADDELSRLEALFRAACDPDRLAALTGALSRHGFALSPVATIDERAGGAPLAWLVAGQRA